MYLLLYFLDSVLKYLLVLSAAAYKLRGEYARLNFPRQQGDQGVLSGGAQSSVDGAGVPPALTNRALTSTLDAKLQEIVYQKALQAQMVAGDKSHPAVEPVKTTSGFNPSQHASSAQIEKFCSVPYAGVADHFNFRESGCSSSSSPCQSPPESSSASESRYASSPSSDTYSCDDLPFDLDDLFSGVPSSEQQLDMSWDVLQLGECQPGTNDVDSTTSLTSFFQAGFLQQQLNGSDGYGSPQSVGECVTSNTGTNIVDVSVKRRSTSPTSATLSPPRKFYEWRHCE